MASTLVLTSAGAVRGGASEVDDLIESINLRLAHSTIQSIDRDGLVVIKAPDENLEFDIKAMSFNYNGLNGDDRVRILCNYCIGRYDGRYLKGTSHRESFLCKSKKHALDVIDAFKRLKATFVSGQAGSRYSDTKLATGDLALPYKTVNEAIDFVDQYLVVSAIMNVSAKGELLINAPDNVYAVDLRKAEFGFKELSDEPKLRIYGEWCMVTLKKGDSQELPRESFQIANRRNARDVIRALYLVKAAFTEMDAAAVEGMRNVTGKRTNAYSTVAQAIDYINDRLTYSIIMRIDDKGNATVNSMEKIFAFDVRAVRFSPGRERSIIKNLISIFALTDGQAVLVEGHDGIEGYEGGRHKQIANEQSFQCGSEADAQDVVKAFEFIKAKLKGGKGN